MEKWEIEYHQHCQELWECEQYCEQEFLSVCEELNEELVYQENELGGFCMGV